MRNVFFNVPLPKNDPLAFVIRGAAKTTSSLEIGTELTFLTITTKFSG